MIRSVQIRQLPLAANIGANGEADIKGIPSRVMNGTIKIVPQVEGYEAMPHEVKLNGNVLRIAFGEGASSDLAQGIRCSSTW